MGMVAPHYGHSSVRASATQPAQVVAVSGSVPHLPFYVTPPPTDADLVRAVYALAEGIRHITARAQAEQRAEMSAKLVSWNAAGQQAPVCEPCPRLPSSNTAYRFWAGDPKAVPLVFRDWIARAAIIGTGLYIAGAREHLLKYSLAGAAAIEVFVLVWVGAQR